ncbi:MAG: UDP-N-acetylglucosamine pyrophosphorylase [Spartobacteria bacterium]|nr:UDP-N-acetylglucosamine pyrophosphorylase [Spartobacteria bacterium]
MALESVVPERIMQLMENGVVIPCAASVEVGKEVDLTRIAPGARIHTGCKIYGADTSMGPGCVIGEEAPVAIDNCQLGHDVRLKGGCFSGAVFLDGASMGSGAHVRAGTLIEEQAGGAHSVGLKQTIFMPYVTAGSLINFCDILMAGGTSRRNHSEIGSSYIHFNFTPHGDKATASLLGDVPRGVMLNQRPIFLGGQGGLVGPARIAYGNVIPAGTIYRKDALEPDQLLLARPVSGAPRPYCTATYRGIERLFRNNLIYIGNILALRAWYETVRLPVMRDDPYRRACCEGAHDLLSGILDERIARLDAVADNLPASIAALERARADAGPESECARQKAFVTRWPGIRERLISFSTADILPAEKEQVRQAFAARGESGYLDAVHALSAGAREAGARWLQAIVDTAAQWASREMEI